MVRRRVSLLLPIVVLGVLVTPLSIGPAAVACAAAPAVTLHKVWIGGDSMAYQIQSMLQGNLRALGVSNTWALCKSSSGIVRTDFFNWPAHLGAALRAVHPQAVVFMVGTNDGQDMTINGSVSPFRSVAWRREYSKRVAAMMQTMMKYGARRVYWVGMPIMRSAAFGQRMALLNSIFRAQAAAHPGVTYVDAWKLFSSASGAFVPTWRSADGIHFSMSGVRRLAGAVAGLVRRDWF
jgi:hypothetical protein